MKAILVIDVPTLDDGRHLCNECPIWNRDRFSCEYDFNTETKGCPLKPMPEKNTWDITKNGHVTEYAEGWNACLKELEK